MSLLSEFNPNDAFVVSLSTQAEVRLRPAAAVAWQAQEVGPTTYELHGVCLAHTGAGHYQGCGIGLRRLDQSWGHGLPYALLHYRNTIAALTLDQNGIPRLSRRRFATLANALEVFRKRQDEWLIACFTASHLHPRLAHADPFTPTIPLPNSYVVLFGTQLYGTFQGRLEHCGEWVLQHFGGQYASAQILERVDLLQDPAGAPKVLTLAQQNGDWFLFAATTTPHFIGCFEQEQTARQAARTLSDTCLLARQVESISLY
jgi:hypothetical protein